MQKFLTFLVLLISFNFVNFAVADIAKIEQQINKISKQVNIPSYARKSFNESNNTWQKWYKAEKIFVSKVLPKYKDEYLSGILEARLNFLKIQPMNIESDVDNSLKFKLKHNPRKRDKINGVSNEFDQKINNANHTAEVSDVLIAERQIQDKWLNEDYKAIRSYLNEEEKLLFRDAQRAWLKYKGKDATFMYEVMEQDGLARDRANFTDVLQFAKRSAQLEYLLQIISAR